MTDDENFIQKFINNFIQTIEENPIKSFFTAVVLIGLVYLGLYYFNNEFFPKLSNEDFYQLGIIFFEISIIILVSLILFIFMPAEQWYILKHSDKKDEKIFSIIILSAFFILLISLLITLIKYKDYLTFFFSLAFFCLIFIFNIAYYKSKKSNDQKRIIIILFSVFIILSFFFSNQLSNLITKTFHFGNYSATLMINNKAICSLFKKETNNRCVLHKINIIWNRGENYIIEINNTRYKIPSKYILMEYFSNSKKN